MITPLRLIFWGSLLCLIDITMTQGINGFSFKFDLFDDFLGMVLVTVGVFRLARFAPSRSCAKGMTFVKVVAVVSTFKELIDHWSFRTTDVWDLAWTAFSLVELTAMVVFCSTMHLLCRVLHLDEPARSWHTTMMLYVVIYTIPLGVFQAVTLVSGMAGRSFNVSLGPWGLLVLPLFAYPLIHFFVSTSRMARAAGHR
jgi:hypothetical protein